MSIIIKGGASSNLAEVKPASTAAVATDPALVVTTSPNSAPQPVTASSLPLPAGAATATNQTTIGAQTTELNDGTRTATIKAGSTAPVAGDTALVVATSPNSPGVGDIIGATVALNAINAAATVIMAGMQSVGMQLNVGTLIGTIVPEISVDGGTTWVGTFFIDPATHATTSSIVFGSANTAATRGFAIPGGTSNARVRVSAYTSGTANCAVRATLASDNLPETFGGTVGSPVLPAALQVGGTDGTNLRTIATDTSGDIKVVGPTATGSPVVNNPVLAGAKDTSGNVRPIISSTEGIQYAAIANNSLASLTNPLTVNAAIVLPDGALDVSIDPCNIFTETFPNTIDTVNRWNAPTTNGAGSSVTATTGSELQIKSVTAAGNFAYITSQPTFNQFGYQGGPAFNVVLEATAVTGKVRFWGIGTIPIAGYAATNPITDGIGFQQTAAGALQAVIYQNGSLVFSAALIRPIDGLPHAYFFLIAGSGVFFFLDDPRNPVAVGIAALAGVDSISPNARFLPINMSEINALGGASAEGIFNFTVVYYSDQSHAGFGIVDGTNPWRRATVSALGSLASAPLPSTTATATSVASNVASQTLLASNTSRKGASIYNDNTANTGTLTVSYAATATQTAFRTKLPPGFRHQVESGYTGAISGIWDVANGNARINEDT